MCGFTGTFAYDQAVLNENTKVRVAALGVKLFHRGPDDQGFWSDQRCAVSHRRLAVIDPDPRSSQPFLSADRRYVLVFNGEIYNHLELRKKLETQGCTFTTSSDTEVLLQLLIREGKRALPQLNGCFALALYDAQNNSMLLARDRMGINPLWYRIDQGLFNFASERKALHYPAPGQLSERALAWYLRFGYIPAPFTIHRGTFKLLPGHLIEVREGVVEEPQQWYDPTELTEGDDRAKHLRELLEIAVSDRLIADVPVGTFLSGGIDSTIVTALAAKHHPKLKSFSIGFADQPLLDESAYALMAAKHIGSDHHHFQLSAKALDASVHTFIESLDEPFADSSGIAVGFLAAETRKYVTVALSGDGADELFGGYRKHRAHAMAAQMPSAAFAAPKLLTVSFRKAFNRESHFGNKMRQLDRLTSGALLNATDRYNAWAAFVEPAELKALMPGRSPASLPFEMHNGDPLNAILFADQLVVLPNDMLTKVDLMSMRHSLEVRTPFLDHRIIAFANRLPAKAKFDRSQGKKILREACADLVPKGFFDRPKKGFEVPLMAILQNSFSDEIEQLASSERLHNSPLNKEAIKTICTAWRRGERRLTQVVWHLFVLDEWLKRNT